MSTHTYIIAEVGPNHNGNIDLALEMIEKLSVIGVDAIKFQLAIPEEVYSKDSFKADYQIRNEGSASPIEMSRKIQLPARDHIKLYEACRKHGVDYMCSAFDLKSMLFLDEHFDMPYYKVPSGEIFSVDIMNYMATQNKPVILSTGMASFDEMQIAIDIINQFEKKDIIILHCISSYPAPYEDVNLRTMLEIGKRFDYPIGFSDHTIGNDAAIAAVALGACVIEKHVTTDKELPGPDHKASITIEEFAELVRSIRNVEKVLGKPDKVLSVTEAGVKSMARKSIVAKCDLDIGHIITDEDLCYKRPGTGVLPIFKDKVIGKKVIKRIEADRVIHLENLQ